MEKRKIIPVTSNKGGTGKTSTAVSLSSSLAARNFKTLLIDLDQQHNATTAFGIKVDADMLSIYDVFFEDKSIDEVSIQLEYDNLSIVPSANAFSSALPLIVTSQMPGKENILKRALDKCEENYDFIILDCPPALDMIIVNALMPATHIIIPTEPSEYSAMGLAGILDFINRYSPYMTEYKGFGTLITSYERRRRTAEGIVQQLRKTEYLNVFDTLIFRSAAMKTAELLGKPINHHAPSCQAAVSYEKFVDEMLEKFKD